ncbi:hypothetical protein [Weissella paramesenteroides]|uniref:hypothetical protein n=1 Tax=Weissella paramesenteroides TaxID=1249 RepID=UPI003D36E88D
MVDNNIQWEAFTNSAAIVDVPNDTKVWFVRSGHAAKYWDDFLYNKYIGIEDEDIESYPIDDPDIPLNLKTVQDYYRNELYKKMELQTSYDDLNQEEINKKKKSMKRSAGRRAGVIRTFRHEIQIGDLILSPGRGTSEFILGIVTSGANKEKINHIKTDPAYEESNFSNIRHVSWLKRIAFSDIPNDVKFIRHGNGSIFDVSEHLTKLLPLFFNYYFFNNLFSARITVGTKKPVTTDSLYLLQKVIVETKNNPDVSISQKTKIESPGYIILTSLVSEAATLLHVLNSLGIVGGLVFLVKYSDKVAGVLATIRDWNHHKKMNKIDEAKAHLSLLESIDQNGLTDKEKEDLNKSILKVVREFDLSNDSAGQDINDEEL